MPRQNRDGGSSPRSSAIELALLGDAFEGFTGTFDPVLIIITFRRKQFDHDIATARCGSAKGRRRVVNRFTDVVLVQSRRNFMCGHRLHWRTRRTDHFGRFRRAASSRPSSCGAGGLTNWKTSRFRHLFRRGAVAFRALFCSSPCRLGGPPLSFC